MQPLNNQNKLDNVLLCGTQIVKACFEFLYDLKICVFVFSWLDTRGFVYLTYFKFNPLLFISYYTEREFNQRGGEQIKIQFCIQRWRHICKSECYLDSRDEVNNGRKYKIAQKLKKKTIPFQRRRISDHCEVGLPWSGDRLKLSVADTHSSR